jgi:hypothetical protein
MVAPKFSVRVGGYVNDSSDIVWQFALLSIQALLSNTAD